MNDDNILSKIPGEILGSAGYSLPAAETSTENTQRLVVRLPAGTRAEMTFVRLKSRRQNEPQFLQTRRCITDQKVNCT